MMNGHLDSSVMISNTLKAFLLHKTHSGETSVQATFLTQEMGMVKSLCKGGRKPLKEAILQPFQPIWLVLKIYSHHALVHHLENLGPSIEFQGDALFSALYMNEILFRLLKPSLPQPLVFDAYLETLRNLALAKNRYEIEALLRRFEWTLLKINGYAFSMTEEAKSGLPIRAEEQYAFIPGSGFFPVTSGISGMHILSMAHDNLEDPDTLRVAKQVMRKAIDHLLGGVAIHARNLYNPASFCTFER